MQVREALLALKNIAPVLREMSLKDVVEITSAHQLFPADLDKTEDEEPIDNLTTSLKSFLALYSKNKKILRCSHQRTKQVNEIKCLRLKVRGWC
ncbi:MAG: hypothetical protein ACXV29_12175 [Halobacteriota archaeon]